MEESTKTVMIDLGGWLFKIRSSAGKKEDQQVLALVHGWTGDENVMSIFARRIPENYWLLYPRGPVAAPSGGYGWLDRQDPNLDYNSYRRIAEQLWERITEWMRINAVTAQPIHLMGFSQGAAICYTLAVEHPDQTGRIAALAGYLPQASLPRLNPGHLAGKEIFIAHGVRDETVPIARAHEARRALEATGAKVTFCEDNVGHKLSAACFRGLEYFFR